MAINYYQSIYGSQQFPFTIDDTDSIAMSYLLHFILF